MSVASPPSSAATPGPPDVEPRSALTRLRDRIDWTAVAALALLALFLQPALHAAVRADDTWTSEQRGLMKLSGKSLPENLWAMADQFFLGSGRPNVLAPTQGLLTSWVFNSHTTLLHAFLIATTLIAAAVLYALVRELGLSRSGALLVVVLLAGAIQFRSYHDAVLGYFGVTQTVLALTLGSLLAFLRGLRGGGKRLFWLSFLLFLPCPFLYEGAYTLVGTHLALALFERRGRAAWWPTLPLLALGVGFVLLSLWARSRAPSIVPGYEVNASPLVALRTYIIQLFAPLPGSNVFFNASFGVFLPLGGEPTKAEILAGAWRGAAVFGLVLILSLRLTGPGGAGLPTGRTLRGLAVVGAGLWLTSVAVLSASPKYQLELVPGKGHLPVLMQVFGWALVAAAALFALLRSAAGRSRTAVRMTALGAAGLLGFGAAVVGYNNMRIVALETPVRETRDLLEKAAGAGLFRTLPDDATLIFQRRDLGWPTGSWAQVPDGVESMLIDRDGRRLDGRITSSPPQPFACPPPSQPQRMDCGPLSRDTAWISVRARREGGEVIVGRVRDAETAKAYTATTRELRVLTENGPPRLWATAAKGRPWNPRGLSWRRVEQGDGWQIYEATVTRGPLPVASTLDDPASRVNFNDLGAPGQIVRRFGTKRLLP